MLTPQTLTIEDGSTASNAINVRSPLTRLLIPGSTSGRTFTVEVEYKPGQYALLKDVSFSGSANPEIVNAKEMASFAHLANAKIRIISDVAPSGTSYEFMVWGS
jgi:hypothetical protein